MINMKRFKVIDDDLMRPDEQPHGVVPDDVFVEVVLAADAEAAIDEARSQEAKVHAATERWSPLSYLQGQRDALAQAVQRVEAISADDLDKVNPLRERILLPTFLVTQRAVIAAIKGDSYE